MAHPTHTRGDPHARARLSLVRLVPLRAPRGASTHAAYRAHAPCHAHSPPCGRGAAAAAWTPAQVHEPGTRIVCEGDEGEAFYMILDGEVMCTKEGVGEVSKRLVKGDFFGELALLSAVTRAASVTAVEMTTTLALDRAAFTRLLAPLRERMAVAEAAQGRT